MERQKFSLPDGSVIRNVQRILVRRNPDDKQKGVDRFFSFDYMGSSEFEWGALPKSMKRIRAVAEEVVEGKKRGFPEPQHVKFHYRGPGFPAFYPKGATKQEPVVETGQEFSFTFLGPAEFIPTVKELFEAQVVSPYASSAGLRERTAIHTSYGLDEFCRSPRMDKDLWRGDVIGWWDIDHDWVAFRNAKHAHLWLEGLRGKT